MDLCSEFANINPSLLLVKTHRHATWAGTYRSYPQVYLQPRSIEELRDVVLTATRLRTRISLVGCGHSPSDLTCTSQVLVNIDHLDKVLHVDEDTGIVRMEAGIRLHDLCAKLKAHGLALANLGSIDHQSIAGAFGTCTHGSSLKHGILSQSCLSMKIMTAEGDIRSCSANENADLFRAALVSLGALGVIIEVTFQTAPDFKIEWEQTLLPLNEIVENWEGGLWTEREFTRCWWMPYTKKVIRWRAKKTDKDIDRPDPGLFSGSVGFHVYQLALYAARWIPSLLKTIEKFVHIVHYGASEGNGGGTTGVEEGHKGLLMNCLYSQLVNEWAIPLHKGPEAITRLSRWLNHEDGSGIPFDSQGVYVHAPIEVRVTDSSTTSPRPYLDFTQPREATLFLNATLYRPYHRDPAGWKRYYEAFEWLMKDMGGRPHWAKNFVSVSKEDLQKMYPELDDWLRIRNEADPEGLFVGDWHRRLLLNGDPLPLEERKVKTRGYGGDVDWYGEMAKQGTLDRRTFDERKAGGVTDMIRLIDHD